MWQLGAKALRGTVASGEGSMSGWGWKVQGLAQ